MFPKDPGEKQKVHYLTKKTGQQIEVILGLLFIVCLGLTVMSGKIPLY